MWRHRSYISEGSRWQIFCQLTHCGLKHPFMSRRLSRPLHQKYFLVCAKHNISSSDYHWSFHLSQLHFQLFFLFVLFSLVVVFFSLDKALCPVRSFAPCEGCSQGVLLGRNWFNRGPYYISKRQQISSVPLVCYRAVFSVVTQYSSGEERCVTTLKTAV